MADGFTDLAKMAGDLLGLIVVTDLRSVTPQLFTAAWLCGDKLVADCICNTIWDYGQQLRTGLHDSSNRKVAAHLILGSSTSSPR